MKKQKEKKSNGRMKTGERYEEEEDVEKRKKRKRKHSSRMNLFNVNTQPMLLFETMER